MAGSSNKIKLELQERFTLNQHLSNGKVLKMADDANVYYALNTSERIPFEISISEKTQKERDDIVKSLLSNPSRIKRNRVEKKLTKQPLAQQFSILSQFSTGVSYLTEDQRRGIALGPKLSTCAFDQSEEIAKHRLTLHKSQPISSSSSVSTLKEPKDKVRHSISTAPGPLHNVLSRRHALSENFSRAGSKNSNVSSSETTNTSVNDTSELLPKNPSTKTVVSNTKSSGRSTLAAFVTGKGSGHSQTLARIF